MLRVILIFVLVAAFIELYAFQAVRALVKARWIQWTYLGISLLILAYIVYVMTQFQKGGGQTRQAQYTMALFLLIYIPKLILLAMMFGEDIFRVFSGLVRAFCGDSKQPFLADRRKFVSQVAMGLAAVPFLSLLYGIAKGKYDFRVIKQTLFFEDLPEAFDGMTITQISDVHSGSFDNADKINYAIDLINEQKSDIVLFTGDIVNSYATEMHPWIESFKRIETPKFGKYSVLGNHDYGEYVNWTNQKDKQENFAAIKDLHRQIDFKLLLNENVKLQKDGQELALIGVENWGKGFKQAGDLARASRGIKENDFKILMSHDPSHWDYEVKKQETKYHLTLSGHTHGMQFGIEIPGFIKWSPVQYRYPQWAGLYEHLGRYIYVNRGFGFHAYSGRVGIWPEITVIELKKGSKVA